MEKHTCTLCETMELSFQTMTTVTFKPHTTLRSSTWKFNHILCEDCTAKLVATFREMVPFNTDYPLTLFWEKWKIMGGRKGSIKKAESKYKNFPERIRKLISEALDAQTHARNVMMEHNASFIPYLKLASTWLNQECWNDEVLTDKEIIDEINNERRQRSLGKQPGTSASWDDPL